MPSENAKAVAEEVIKHVRNGQKVNLGKIIRSKGYKESIAKRPSKVTDTKSYKEAMKPLLERLEEERDRAIRLLRKRISKAKYRDLIDALDKITKNHQLLSGGVTERHGLNLTDLFKRVNDGG